MDFLQCGVFDNALVPLFCASVCISHNLLYYSSHSNINKTIHAIGYPICFMCYYQQFLQDIHIDIFFSFAFYFTSINLTWCFHFFFCCAAPLRCVVCSSGCPCHAKNSATKKKSISKSGGLVLMMQNKSMMQVGGKSWTAAGHSVSHFNTLSDIYPKRGKFFDVFLCIVIIWTLSFHHSLYTFCLSPIVDCLSPIHQ